MIELSNGKLIQEPILDILYDLRRELIKKDINKLSDIIVKGPNALITCPNHKDGKESHPSCYVRLEDGDNISAGTVHCFTCGYKTILSDLISKCFGFEDCGKYGEKWIEDHFSYSYLTQRRELKKITNKAKKEVVTSPTSFISSEELQSYRFYHPYMFERRLTKEVIDRYDIGFDKKTNSVTFPVYDNDNNCLFVVKRCVSFKKFYIPKGIEKCIFGINQIPKDCNQVIVCESVFNALTCAVYGKVGIALFGTGSNENYKTLNKLGIRHYILMFDGDSAGRKGAEKFKANVKGKIITDIVLPKGKDVNDLSQDEFNELLSKYGIQ